MGAAWLFEQLTGLDRLLPIDPREGTVPAITRRPRMPSPDTVAAVLRHADASLDASRGRLFDLLSIPSISAQPDHRQDCQRAAEWVRDQLAGLGFTAAVRPTAGHPVIVAHHAAPAGYKGPHILFYGHYDVQPVDPLNLWHSPPFDPQLVDGPRGKRFVARGAVDDKGQAMMFIEAMRAWKEAAGGIPAHITALIEGEEEVGSPNLEPFLVANKTELAADLALISDTGMWDVDTPALTTRLRGMTYVQITLKAANRDLHSGLYGGSALNPINALAHMLGDLQDANGRIQLPGFYDKVKPVSNAQRAQWDALGFDEHAFPGHHRSRHTRRRARLFSVGASLGASNRRHQRHVGRLYWWRRARR